MKRLIAMAFICLSPVPAGAGFYTYSQWEALTPNGRANYMAGAFDALTTFIFDEAGTRMAQHYLSCVSKTKMNNGQLAENVRIFASSRPEVQALPPQAALLQYLVQLCGRAPD
jgi:hypothetical protein